MIRKIDISRIVADHLSTLKDPGTEDWSWYDIGTFYGVPAFLAVLHLVIGGVGSNEVLEVDGIVVSAFSIFAALLLNVQVLIIGLKERLASVAKPSVDEAMSPEDSALAERLAGSQERPLQELFANVSYAILVSILLVTLTLVVIFLGIADWRLTTAMQFFGIAHFALTSVMVLKRMHVVFLQAHR